MSTMPMPGMPQQQFHNPFEAGGFDPSSFNFIGGSNNGLQQSGAWASGGFNTQGSPIQPSGFNFFSGTNPNTPNMSMPGGSSFPAFSAPGLPGVSNPSSPFSFGGNTTGGSNPSSFLPQVTGKDLSKIYGKGVGGALASFLNSGAGFNPQVMQAQLNEAMPMAARSEAKMMDMFGNTGNAYSSTASIGIGDFESQFNAALQGEFAQEYQQSVQNYLNVLMGVAPDAKQYQAEKPNWMSIAGNIMQSIIPFFG